MSNQKNFWFKKKNYEKIKEIKKLNILKQKEGLAKFFRIKSIDQTKKWDYKSVYFTKKNELILKTKTWLFPWKIAQSFFFVGLISNVKKTWKFWKTIRKKMTFSISDNCFLKIFSNFWQEKKFFLEQKVDICYLLVTHWNVHLTTLS